MIVYVVEGPASECEVRDGVSTPGVNELGANDVMIASVIKTADEGPIDSEGGSYGLVAPASVAELIVVNLYLALDRFGEATDPPLSSPRWKWLSGFLQQRPFSAPSQQ